MPAYLIDANLPANCPVWDRIEAVSILQMNPALSDTDIWELARKDDLTIVSKDADFYQRILHAQPPPKVVHIKCGNMRLAQFNRWLEDRWIQIEDMLEEHKLVNVYLNRIEGIK